MTARFTDHIVLVTGAGSGIGRATAAAFAAEGAIVMMAGRSIEPLRQTAKLIAEAGGTADPVAVDVSRESEVEQLISTIVERHGRLDVAVNNAGVFAGGPVAEFELSEWQRLMDTNVTGVLLAMKHQIRQMRTQGGGTIVNIASNVGAHKSLPYLGAYGASKAAVAALSRAAAVENIGDGIRINAVSPGPTDTRMSFMDGETEEQRADRMTTALPLGRVGAVAEVASAVLWLASPEAGFAVGHDLVIDGGASL